MRRKILTAGFLSAILIIVTLTSFATSNSLKSQNEADTKTNGNLMTTLEAALDESNDIALDELLAAEQLIQEQIMQKIVAEYELITPAPMICDNLLDAIAHWRAQANEWRDNANLHPDIITWVRICNMIANRCDAYADIFQSVYDVVCA